MTVKETRKDLESFFHMATWALWFLVMILLAQGAEGASVKSACKLGKSTFRQHSISHRIMSLAQQGSLFDNETSTRLLESSMFSDVEATNHCYMMKEVLNLVLKEVLPPYQQKFQSDMQDVLSFLHDLKSKLSGCTLKGDGSPVQRKINDVKSKLKQLGKNGEIKAISELDLLFRFLGRHCA
ncbi:interleukin-22 isoform X2 [Phascolarctos cinereus]|uniref:Interleukin-22 n=1 Tax=Phascolarctos cinereus TaxID=38626 RepID=A0A6P5KLU6_PHACI|nr:interleukin-22 [Phascolarctos cinereus]